MTGFALWSAATGTPLTDVLIGTTAAVAWSSLPIAAPAAVCPGALRLLTDIRWYWIRPTAVLLFAVPFPLLPLALAGPAVALPAAAVN